MEPTGGPQREDAFPLLAAAREAAVQERFSLIVAAGVDTVFATEKARTGDLEGAVELSRPALECGYASGGTADAGRATDVLVEVLLRRGGTDADLEETQLAIDRLAAVPTVARVCNRTMIWLLRLRALLARAHGDTTAYRDYRDRYRGMATELGFEGHMKMAEAMP